MDELRLNECMLSLKELKKDTQENQKKGLPFMMSSVAIWTMILITQLINKPIEATNLYIFMCSCFMMPLAFVFSKVVKVDIFKKTDNPVNKLGFLCTMNQMLYLLIVMWAYSKSPEAMLMLYAMVFGAHLLPYGWIYDSRAYTFAAITETIVALIFSYLFGKVITVAFMIVMQIVVCICLIIENRKAKTDFEN